MANSKSRKPLDHDVQYKVLMIGESRIGKTSILKRLNNEQFTESTISTVGVDFINVFYNIENVRIKLQIWDTAGQERYRTITRNYYRNTKGIVLVFDLTDRDSYQKLEYWLESLEELQLDAEIIYLVGNKLDLETEREVSYAECKQFAERNLIKYFETSAKTRINLAKIFESLAFDLLDGNHMQKMDRYRPVGKSFVFDYQMPSTIILPKTVNATRKRKLCPAWLKKRLKAKKLLSKTSPHVTDLKKDQVKFKSNQSVNILTQTPNKQTNFETKKTRSLNCLLEVEHSSPKFQGNLKNGNRGKSTVNLEASTKSRKLDKCCTII